MSNPTPDTGTLPGTALETYGKLLNGDAGRDAIHLAVYAVTTDERLFPGQHVGISSVVDGIKVSAKAPALIGIVDPFLVEGVYPGQWFWLTLYPRTITSLRHEWTHPAFDVTIVPTPAVVDPKVRSEAWLRNYAGELNETFDDLIKAGDYWVESSQYYYGDAMFGAGYNGKFEGVKLHPDYWHHYQVYKGVVVDPEKQESFFTCAC